MAVTLALMHQHRLDLVQFERESESVAVHTCDTIHMLTQQLLRLLILLPPQSTRAALLVPARCSLARREPVLAVGTLPVHSWIGPSNSHTSVASLSLGISLFPCAWILRHFGLTVHERAVNEVKRPSYVTVSGYNVHVHIISGYAGSQSLIV